MAAIGKQPQHSLVGVFAEFSLLPDLLAKVSPRQQVQTLNVWSEFLQGSGVNTDQWRMKTSLRGWMRIISWPWMCGLCVNALG